MRLSMTSKSYPSAMIVLAAAVAAGVAGAVLRYGLIEYKPVHNFCVAAAASRPCGVRSLVIVSLMNTPALGLLALALGLFALMANRRAVAIAAVVTGALGLLLYNTGLGACGLLLGALQAVRDGGGGPSSPPSPARRRENTS